MAVAVALGSNGNNFTNLGSLYNEVLTQLSTSQSPQWIIKSTKTISGRFNLLFGEAQAGNINWKILAGYNSLYPGLNPLINYYRGFQSLCRKAMMVKTLKEYIRQENLKNEQDRQIIFEKICPETYIFYPAKRQDSEIEEFLKGCQQNPQKIWILKPSDGTKGHSIQIMSNPDEILQFMDSQSDGSIAWVVQRYLERPLLIPTGQRKFDIRIWVLLDSSYRIHVYNQGVLRVTAKPYDVNNFSDHHSHLSNHCIAETHPDYGRYEPTNEIWFNEFELILSEMSEGRLSFHRDVIPRIHKIIQMTLMAVREKWECEEGSAYRSFAVFGYDFMLTESEPEPGPGSETREEEEEVKEQNTLLRGGVDVWLIEINSSPMVAEKLLSKFASRLIDLAINSVFERGEGREERREGGEEEPGGEKEEEKEEKEGKEDDFTTL